ncbi:hypothetical protein IQ268_10230 [Oculatella sp. LEGE 06141]|uniref:hypothetical protein n=1 Tax=Oculatella sp. LEGE 06141 TaxID=1828648 RepID=UPI0019D874B9|nr:hypothetical protein [Oculatella sp. LEGE 06141]MBE9178938.1 hypothetical protein [Oculatella sp. LEGE 06141]
MSLDLNRYARLTAIASGLGWSFMSPAMLGTKVNAEKVGDRPTNLAARRVQVPGRSPLR